MKAISSACAAAHARCTNERGKPGIVHLPDRNQPFDHKGTVDADQWHHIANRRQGDKVEKSKQIGLQQPRIA